MFVMNEPDSKTWKVIEEKIYVISSLNNVLKDTLNYREKDFDLIDLSEIIEKHLKDTRDLF